MASLNRLSQLSVHIEVVQNEESSMSPNALLTEATRMIRAHSLVPGAVFRTRDFSKLSERPHVRAIHVGEAPGVRDLSEATLKFHVYRLNSDEAGREGFDDGEGESPAATRWALPSEDFYGLWESLVYDTGIKEDVLGFVESAMLFADRGVDPNIITLNRVVLLHGPPGTGKTSLCRALAQKLAIRFNQRYETAELIEINSHSLFSKWFSESGKLVLKLFDRIVELIEDSSSLICVLIDEIESLTHARQAAFAGTEPSDSIRVVNAVLTQLDRIRKYPNVLIFTTSNMTGAIDPAFTDRADIKRFVGMPSKQAIYNIYLSCITELMRTNIIVPTEKLFEYELLKMCDFESNPATYGSLELLQLAELSEGVSGRTLRKMPLLAHAIFLIDKQSVDFKSFLCALRKIIIKHSVDSDAFKDVLNHNT